MSRPLRIEYPGAWYHVMNRGKRGETIYATAQDFNLFLRTLQEASDLWKLRVAAYCLLSNHYHLLVQTPDGNLSRAMRHVDGVYTQRFNRIHGHDGPLFRGRYKSILVDADSYLLKLVRYIHCNPVNAGICATPDSYEWSSHAAYTSRAARWEWLYRQKVMSMLNPQARMQMRAYRRLMSHDGEDVLDAVFDGERWPSMLGSETFIERIRGLFEPVDLDPEIPQMRELVPEVRRIKAAVCEVYGVMEESLLKSTRGVFNEARNVAIFLTRSMRGDSLRRIGEEYGVRKTSSVGSVIVRMKREMLKSKKLTDRVEGVQAKLSKSQEQT